MTLSADLAATLMQLLSGLELTSNQKGDYWLFRSSWLRKFCAVARTRGLDLFAFSGKLHNWLLVAIFLLEIIWGRRALALAYNWWSQAGRCVIDVLSVLYLTTEKVPPCCYLLVVEVGHATTSFSGT